MIAKRLLVGLGVFAVVTFTVLTAETSPPVRAQSQPPFPVPHGNYSTATDMCRTCHAWHADPDAGLIPSQQLLRLPGQLPSNEPSESDVCFACHDGSASGTNTKGEFSAPTVVSTHPVLAPKDGATTACSDCHAEHQSPEEDIKLLYREMSPETWIFSPPDNPIGDTFCYGCHGSSSTLPAPFGDKGLFETSIHATSNQVVPTTPGTDIKCSACHESHASNFPYLTTADQEDLCFTCHTLADPNTANGSSPKRDFNVAVNDYATNDGNGIRIYHHPIATTEQAGGTRTLECASCHNSHLVDRTQQTASDPARARAMDSGWPFSWISSSGLYNRSTSAADFCETCHVDPTTTSPLNVSAAVPYDVRLVDDTGTDADGQEHDKFTYSWFSSGAESAHGNPSYVSSKYLGCPPGGPCTLSCTACHDFHGSTNAYMLREDVVSPDYGPLAVTAATWDGTGGGTATLTVGPHGMARDWYVTITGMSPPGFNGTWVLTSVAANTVSFSLPTDPGAFVSGGTLSPQGVDPGRSTTATVTGFGGLDTAADRLALQTFCLTCHLEQSSTHQSGSLCTECHNHSSTSQREF